MSEAAVLDGLVWAQLSEKARVARIAAGLVRAESSSYRGLTKAAIHEAVKATLPPHGRGKAICEAVAEEVRRQEVIWAKRQKEQDDWRIYLATQEERKTRLNLVYAARFGRPMLSPRQSMCTELAWGEEGYFEAQQEWHKKEEARDKGDTCVGILIFREVYTVALLETRSHLLHGWAIAVADRRDGTTCYTPLREHCVDFVEAAISLGGPKVRSAFAQGHQVSTDWVGRRTTITYPDGKSITLPWLTSRTAGLNTEEIAVIGDEIVEIVVEGKSED